MKFTLAVGGVIVYNQKVLLVQRAAGARQGDWQIPGGLVEVNETPYTAIRREIFEETGVQAEIQGLIAVLNRVLEDEGENNTYFIFQMEAGTEAICIDGIEVGAAGYFSLDEMHSLPRLQALSLLAASAVLEDETVRIAVHPHPSLTLERAMFLADEHLARAFEQLSPWLWHESRIKQL